MITENNRKRPGGRLILKGAALLGGAALLSKAIGTLQKIPLQNFAGDEVFGMYSAVYALAVMWLTLAAAGIPTAVSVMVAEREASGDEAGAQRVVRWSLGLLCASGFAAFAVLQLGADLFAGWMGMPDAAPAIRTSAIALLIAPATAVLRGCRQGQMRMQRPAVSQIAEQIARVFFMLILLGLALKSGWSSPATAAAVHGGLAAGAAAGLAAMLWPETRRKAKIVWIRRGEVKKRIHPAQTNGSRRVVQWPEDRRTIVRSILGVALPVAAASMVVPLFALIDAFSIPRLLQREGAEAAFSIAEYGIYNRGIALVQLVLMAAGGAAAALVPSMTAARKLESGDAEASRRAASALRAGWWFGSAAAIGLALLAEPINTALFADASGTAAIVLLAPAAAFGTVQAVSGGVLQGCGDLRSPAVNLAVAAIFKLSLNAVWVPAYGIRGAAAALTCAYGAALLLNAMSLRHRLRLPALSAAAWRPAAALAAMAASVSLAAPALGALTRGLPARAGALLTALPGVGAGALTFAAALVAAGAVGPQQWQAIPGFAPGSRMDAWLGRLHNAFRRRADTPPTSREG